MIDSASLQRYSFFGGLLEEQINVILPLMQVETFNPGDIIIEEGTPNDKIRFIIGGTVAVSIKEKLIWELGEGSTFGEMEVLDVMPSAATVKAVTNVTVMSMSNQSLRMVYQRDIKVFALLLMNLARDLSRRLRMADEKMTGKR